MRTFRNGEQVIVPFGLGEVTGTVIDSYGPEDFHVVTVRLELIEPVDDPEEDDDDPIAPLEVGFLAENIRPVAA